MEDQEKDPLKAIQKSIELENKLHQSSKRNYSKDKSGWVHSERVGVKKMKLRAFIRSRAKDLVFLDDFQNSEIARQKLIDIYENDGINAIDRFVNEEYLKEVHLNYEEFKDLGNDERR